MAELNWHFGDGESSLGTNSPIHKYANTVATKCVSVYKGTATDITGINMASDDIVGVVDVSSLSNLVNLDLHSNAKLTNVLVPKSPTAASIGLSIYSCPSFGPVFDASSLTNLSGFQVYQNSALTTIKNPPTSQTINAYYVFSCNLTGNLDVSGLNLQGNFRAESNPKLTSITGLGSSQSITFFRAYDCSLNGNLDLSKLTALGGVVDFHGNRNLTSVSNPSSNTSFVGGTYSAYNCNLTGTLDVSGFKNLGGQFFVYNNPKLTKIIHTNSTRDFSHYYANDCSLNGTLDVSGLSNLGGEFKINNNNNLQVLTLPTTLARQFTVFNAKNCSLNTASIDAALLKLHNLYDASAPVANLTINFDGTGNSWPTDGSSNVDYLGIYSAFTAAGKNASININYPPYIPPPEFPTNGLEAYWKFDETSGTVVDQTDNDNDLTTSTKVTYSQTGKINTCVLCSSAGYLQGTSDTIGTTVFSISAWLNTSYKNKSNYIFDCGDSVLTKGYTVELEEHGYLRLLINDKGAAYGFNTDMTENPSINDGIWHHAVITYNGTASGAKFYVDGQEQSLLSDGSIATGNVGGTYRVGNSTNSWIVNTLGYGFKGNLDEIGVWSVVLSATDASTLYNNGNGLAYPGP